jgi:Na+/proline symporter
MIGNILKWLIGAVVVIFILLWLVDGGFGNVRAQADRFSFTSPWSWATSTVGSIDNFVTGHGMVALPSVQGVGPATTSAQVQEQSQTQTPSQSDEARLQQLQAQYENLKIQAQTQGAVQ